MGWDLGGCGYDGRGEVVEILTVGGWGFLEVGFWGGKIPGGIWEFCEEFF